MFEACRRYRESKTFSRRRKATSEHFEVFAFGSPQISCCDTEYFAQCGAERVALASTIRSFLKVADKFASAYAKGFCKAWVGSSLSRGRVARSGRRRQRHKALVLKIDRDNRHGPCSDAAIRAIRNRR